MNPAYLYLLSHHRETGRESVSGITVQMRVTVAVVVTALPVVAVAAVVSHQIQNMNVMTVTKKVL